MILSRKGIQKQFLESANDLPLIEASNNYCFPVFKGFEKFLPLLFPLTFSRLFFRGDFSKLRCVRTAVLEKRQVLHLPTIALATETVIRKHNIYPK